MHWQELQWVQQEESSGCDRGQYSGDGDKRDHEDGQFFEMVK